MTKAVKRQAQSNVPETSSTKTTKFYDLNLITKDISMLETFYDFIDSEKDIINEYLISHDFNDFLNYFKSYNLYKSSEFSLVFRVCTQFLMRIADDLQGKYSLIGQNFADLFIKKYKPIIHTYLRRNESKKAVKSCIKFVTGLILQGTEIAFQLAAPLNLFKTSFNKQLSVRSQQDEDDVHTCVLNCFAAFFVVGNNAVIRKLCENRVFISMILKDLRFDKFDNVQLVIEILHDKIIKNTAVSKTIKIKLFNVTNLHYLIAVYCWKREAVNYDEFHRITDIDPRCSHIHNQLHQLITDICSQHFGVAFTVNNICDQSKSNIQNICLYKLLTSDVMNDFFTHALKKEIVNIILRTCPDLIAPFIDYLSTIMMKIVPQGRRDVLGFVNEYLQLITNEKLDEILSESLSYLNGDKFTEAALILCGISATLVEIIKTTNHQNCAEGVEKLRDIIENRCERVFTWINVSEDFETIEQREKVKIELQGKVIEMGNDCGLEESFKKMFKKELKDKTMFLKIKKDQKNKDLKMVKNDFEYKEDIDENIKQSVEILNGVNNNNTVENVDASDAFKECLKYLLLSPFTSVSLLKVVTESLCKNKVAIKKKQRRKLFDTVLSSNIIAEFWMKNINQDDDYERKEIIRTYIFDIIIFCVDNSKSLMLTFYETIHPLKLLSAYGGTLSQCDQNIFYLLSIHQLFDVSVPNFDIIMFGNAVNEHYRIESAKAPVLLRPIIESQCFNLLTDERMIETINNFPIDRLSPVSVDNKMSVFKPQGLLYDPCFLLEWISQLLAKDDESQQEFIIGGTVELKTVFSKRIIQFLVACQSSNSPQTRLVSKILLGKLIERIDDYENVANDLPAKMQVQMILYHMFNSLSAQKKDENLKLSSIFTNFYVRILQLLETPDKKIFSTLWEMIISNECFDLKYVPDFLFMVYSDKEDYRIRQLWCLHLLSDSIKDFDDFCVLLNTKVIMNVLSLFPILEPRGKAVVLRLIKKCSAIPKAAETLRKSAGFLTWLNCTMRNKDEKDSKQSLLDIVETLLSSLKDSKNFEDLETILKLNL